MLSRFTNTCINLDMNGAGPTALDRYRLVHFFALVIRAAESK